MKEGEKHELQKFNNFVLFTAENGKVNIDVYFHDETLWLTQKAIAELFEKGRSTITEHLKKIFNEGELDEFSVCRDFRRTAEDGIDKSMKKFKDKMKKALSSICLDISRLRNRLQKQYIATALASEKYFTFSRLCFYRLRNRLRISQINPSSSLQPSLQKGQLRKHDKSK